MLVALLVARALLVALLVSAGPAITMRFEVVG